MKTTLYSCKLDLEVTFSRPGSSYIYADTNGQSGALGRQICVGGYLMGDTLSYDGEDQKQFETICRNWFKKYIKNQTED